MPRSFYIIQERGTGKYIPLPTKLGCGFTQVEVTDERPPRMFLTPEAARGALREWLKGYQYNEWDNDHYDGPFVKETPHRVKDNMEIVEIGINVL